MEPMELQIFPLKKENGNARNGHFSDNNQLTAANGEGCAVEQHPLLTPQAPESNGETLGGNVSVHTVPTQNPVPPGSSARATKKTHEQLISVQQMRRELNEVVFWKVRLWMVMIFILLLLLAVIGISLALCSVIHRDADEEFDSSSFRVQRNFSGTFRLTNQNFTDELLSPSSNQSQELAAELQEQLRELYSSSPALGRYFSKAEIFAFRNGSVVAHFRLHFLLPVDHAELEKFTLSRELVFNVFRQFLFDQEGEGRTAIEPASLSMF